MTRCTILGCGGSKGVPQVGCHCDICKVASSDSSHKNNRTRVSIFVEYQGVNFLVDTSSDFRIQALRNDLSRLDAILYTHAHADHVNGIDDIKPLILQRPGSMIDAHMSQKTYEVLSQRYPYVFEGGGLYKPYIKPHIFGEEGGFDINGVRVEQYLQYHGRENKSWF